MCTDGGDADALGLSAEERWLLHEDKPPTGWVYGTARDHVRTQALHRMHATSGEVRPDARACFCLGCYATVCMQVRMDRFRRSGAGADHYERKLAEAEVAAG